MEDFRNPEFPDEGLVVFEHGNKPAWANEPGWRAPDGTYLLSQEEIEGLRKFFEDHPPSNIDEVLGALREGERDANPFKRTPPVAFLTYLAMVVPRYEKSGYSNPYVETITWGSKDGIECI